MPRTPVGRSGAPTSRAPTSRAPTGRPGTSRPATSRPSTAREPAAPPVLVEHRRDGFVESRHRGHIVRVDAAGRPTHVVGDAATVVTLRSIVKPFAVVPLLESGAARAFALTRDELALMASSHSGEDLHVRTLQGVLRRAGVSQALLACGTEGAPLDRLTASRLARDGEAAGAIRHNCSGFHAASILLSKHAGWTLEDYWRPEHPAQQAIRTVVARVFDARPDRLGGAIDACGVPTYGFSLTDVARAYLLLADPSQASGARASLATPLTTIRDAMIAAPEMVAGTRERVDTELMKAASGRLIAKGGSEAVRAIAVVPRAGEGAAAMAIKIEDGDGRGRAISAATVEAARQARMVDDEGLRRLAAFHRRAELDPRGEPVAEAVPIFTLAAIGPAR